MNLRPGIGFQTAGINAIAILIGVLLVAAAIGKSLDPDSLIALLTFDGFSARTASMLRIPIILAEAAIGTMLICSIMRGLLLKLLPVLFVLFIAQQAFLLTHSNPPSCNCFGILEQYSNAKTALITGMVRNGVVLLFLGVAWILSRNITRPVAEEVPARMGLQRAGGFTLVELMTVIALVGVLLTLMMPAISKVRMASLRTSCASNLRQLGVAASMYATHNRGYIPRLASYRYAAEWGWWTHQLQPYLGIKPALGEKQLHRAAVFQCPAHPRQDIPTGYVMNSCVFDESGNYGTSVRAPTQMSKIKNSSQTAYLLEASDIFMIMDLNDPEIWTGIKYVAFHKIYKSDQLPDGEYPRVTDVRHGTSSNILYFDFHVAPSPKGGITADILNDGVNGASLNTGLLDPNEPLWDRTEPGI